VLRKFGEDQRRGFRAMRADRQTDRPTDRRILIKTLCILPEGEVITGIRIWQDKTGRTAGVACVMRAQDGLYTETNGNVLAKFCLSATSEDAIDAANETKRGEPI